MANPKLDALKAKRAKITEGIERLTAKGEAVDAQIAAAGPPPSVRAPRKRSTPAE